MRKKRLLMCTEFSQLATGYSTYTKNLLERLYATNKYEIAELACYCSPNDPRRMNVPWKTYPVLPPEGNQAAHNQYTSNPINQFGEWKFEETCLDFLPDVVFDIRDFWMLQFEELTPFRPFFNWAICPTVDSIPQNEDWISTYLSADAVFTYTDWSLDVLKDEGGGLIKTQCEVPAGVELDIFKPVQSKSEHKRMFGFRDDVLIIGTVNRNQKRKLYPDLFESFAKLVEENPTLADRVFLYCHTNFPDIGYDIIRIMKKNGIAHKVLFTYVCMNCGLVFPQIYQDVRTICPKCKTANVVMPSTQRGIDRKSLAAIYNLFDLYIQYSICEGFGLGAIEAAACAIPVMEVDYSAMSDVVRKLNGYPIKVQRMFHESETGCMRALPDNSDLVNKMVNFLQLPESMRAKKGFEARKGAEKYYNWDRTANRWMEYFDSVEIKPWEQTWFSPPRLFSPSNEIPTPQQLTDSQFIDWALINVLGEPNMVGSYTALKMSRDLLWGTTNQGFSTLQFNDQSLLGSKPQYSEYNRNIVCETLKKLAAKRNYWEKIRYEKLRNKQ